MIKFYKDGSSAFAKNLIADRIIVQTELTQEGAAAEQEAILNLVAGLKEKFSQQVLANMPEAKAADMPKIIKEIELKIKSNSVPAQIKKNYEFSVFIYKIVNDMLEDEIVFETI